MPSIHLYESRKAIRITKLLLLHLAQTLYSLSLQSTLILSWSCLCSHPHHKAKISLLNQYSGLPNDASDGPFLAAVFHIVQNHELEDINDNHVEIDISSLISNISKLAAYYFANVSDIHDKRSKSINSGEPIQAWIDYDSKEMSMNVSISPQCVLRPHGPLISFPIDLSLVLDEYMYVGFSGSTGLLTALHYVHGWSFNIDGKVQDLDSRNLPFLKKGSNKVVHKKGFAVARGLGEKNLIGYGGFGRVYRGVIPSTGLEVAIKRVSNGSRQGMKEFIAEIRSMGRLRHQNLVH
ncbi:L-type lectin-domain containing receptor kinase S.4-like [Durio zibethinus]|uniref:L-type lectin-domain containing receptor kinase S.4-like n=1 Tax=Durio zibethinus TaxID=66656 RepID=A0A6P6ABH2_DURZI|nr:L-type lectin-domain containing receptor kinase S.4-like [Durio zibethinus]